MWDIAISRAVEKQIKKLPKVVRVKTFTLIRAIETRGPVRGEWPNYGKLTDDKHHCHIKKGTPSYVCVWRVTDNDRREVEIIYAGTHERAPY